VGGRDQPTPTLPRTGTHFSNSYHATDEMVASLPGTLEVLHLTNSCGAGFGDSGYDLLVTSAVRFTHLPQLQIVRIYSSFGGTTALGDEAILSLPPTVETLTIPGSSITGALTFTHLPRLRELDIQGCAISEALLASLPATLETLDIRECTGVAPNVRMPAHLKMLITIHRSPVRVATAAPSPAPPPAAAPAPLLLLTGPAGGAGASSESPAPPPAATTSTSTTVVWSAGRQGRTLDLSSRAAASSITIIASPDVSGGMIVGFPPGCTMASICTAGPGVAVVVASGRDLLGDARPQLAFSVADG